jgi:hypothetical protein
VSESEKLNVFYWLDHSISVGDYSVVTSFVYTLIGLGLCD